MPHKTAVQKQKNDLKKSINVDLTNIQTKFNPGRKTMATCPNCNKEVKENAKFCRHCGSKIEQKPAFVFCDECGAKLEAGATFCDECGAKLEGGAPAQNDDPWADFKDFKQPETIVVEKVVNKAPAKPKADMTRLKNDFEKGCAFYDAGEYSAALPLMLPLAQEGDKEAEFRVGMCYSMAENHTTALEWLQKARDKEHMKASYNIGWMYGFGKGVAKDESKWFKYTKESAILGFITAQQVLGKAYYYGWHELEENNDEAFKWLSKAANATPDIPARAKLIAEAQFLVGECYDYGRGVEENKDTAYQWYKKASDGGYVAAHAYLGCAYENGWYGFKEDKNKAFKLYEKGAKAGDGYAQVQLGACYENGVGTLEIKKDAFNWYKKAAENDMIAGKCYLGRCYAYGIGTNPNPAEGIKWLKEAAEDGSAEALDVLGYIYFEGIAGKVDYNKALEYFQQAADADYWSAYHDMAQVYLKQNKYLDAAKTLKKGSDFGDLQCMLALMTLKNKGGSIEKMIKELEDAE